MVFRHNRGCPHCGGTLSLRRTQSYSYERCDRCRGLWLSLGVISAMVAAMEPSAHIEFVPGSASGARTCPDCNLPLTPAALFRIPVDHCTRDHMVWFDKDELRQVLERVGDEIPPPPEPPTSFTGLLEDFFRG